MNVYKLKTLTKNSTIMSIRLHAPSHLSINITCKSHVRKTQSIKRSFDLYFDFVYLLFIYFCFFKLSNSQRPPKICTWHSL